MTDMVFQFGQFLYNNTADVAIEGVAAVTGIDKSTVALGTGVVTALGTVAVGTALTFKYGDQCRKKLSRNSKDTTVTPTPEKIQPVEQTPAKTEQLTGGGEQPELGAIPTEEANATENAHEAAVHNGNVPTTPSSTIGQRINGGELERKARSGIKIYK